VSTISTSQKPTAGELIDPATLMRINSLELRARLVVEGFWSGLNRSPYHGFSVEFTEYRQYTPGDDPRYLDWKLFARSDRYYIKRYEDETNLRCHLLLDLSRSMEYGSLSYTKLDYARTLVATLAYFLSTQRDAVGLVTFHEQIEETIPARYRVGHLRRLLVALERQVGGADTNLIRPLEQIAERVSKRGMLILVSDLLAPVDQLETNLGYLRARGHEVLLFHVIDPAELKFEFDQPTLFEDPESQREIYVDPSKARESYLRKLEAHLAGVRSSCERLGITYRQFSTDAPLESALSEFLRSRLHKNGRPVGHRRNQGRRAL
jgi:uncharacterized protein (DUF58 family)